MELNHPVAPAVIIGNPECPFPHEEEEWPDCDNDFQGSGSTLGSSLNSGKQTINNRTATGTVTSAPMPREDPSSSLHGQATPIKLGGLTPEDLPLTCAAHHLIPAQASLRGSNLVVYLYKGSATFNAPGKKGSTVTKGGGKLKKNAGYDVNGSQNGVWLPGPYALRKSADAAASAVPRVRALRGKEKPIPVVSIAMVEDPEAEDQPPSGLGEAGEPGGAKKIGNRKVPYYLLYTISAMRQTVKQYHDAHPAYSKFVLDCLNAIAEELNEFAYEGACKQCPKRKPSDKLPPPYNLVVRLNDVSTRLCNYLKGLPSGWVPNIYTSAMSVEFGKVINQSIQLSDCAGPPAK